MEKNHQTVSVLKFFNFMIVNSRNYSSYIYKLLGCLLTLENNEEKVELIYETQKVIFNVSRTI